MQSIVLALPHRVKVRIRRLRRRSSEAGLALRCQIVLLAAQGRASRAIAESLGCSRSWASRVIRRFRAEGESSLWDRREDNGILKLDEHFLQTLYELVEGRPTDFGWRRPTWTCELLVKAMEVRTGVRVHPGTMSRALRQIGARRGRPRPTVRCPWSASARQRRLASLRSLTTSPRRGEVVVYADEVDIDLNPKLGFDWMNRGQQKEVLTPGNNEKRYLAGALNPRTGELTCVEGPRKTSALVIALLRALAQDYSNARKTHVILDNFRIHDSRITRQALAEYEGRIMFHFLPPYCPNENRIERLWLDLHAETTRNHGHATMDALMDDVWRFIARRAVGGLKRHRAA
jgi:transposase